MRLISSRQAWESERDRYREALEYVHRLLQFSENPNAAAAADAARDALRDGDPENQSQRVTTDAAASRAVQGGGSDGSPPAAANLSEWRGA